MGMFIFTIAYCIGVSFLCVEALEMNGVHMIVAYVLGLLYGLIAAGD